MRCTPTVTVRCTFRDTEGVRRSVPAAPLWWERGNGNDDGYNFEAVGPSSAGVSGGGQRWSAART